MYQVNLNISLVGADDAISGALRQVAPPERFHLQFHCFPALTGEAVQGDLLILCAGASNQELEQITTRRPAGAMTVLCADSSRLAGLTARQLQGLDGLWPAPLTAETARFQLDRLLQSLKQRKDAWLYRNYLDSAINSIPELVWFKDAKGAHLKVNQSFCQTVNKTMEQIEGRGHYYIWDIPEEEYKQGEFICMESEEEVMGKGCTCLFDENVKTKRGMRQFKTYKSPIFDEDGKGILGTVGVAHDVTDLNNINHELELIVSSIPWGAVVCDEEWQILSVNKTARHFLSGAGAELDGMDYRQVKRAVVSNIRLSKHPGFSEGTIFLQDTPRTMQFQEVPITDVFQHVTGHLCLYSDVTWERSYETQMLKAANTDSLTGLSTRRHLFSALASRSDGLPAALLYMDMDNFKGINDHFGHQFGDQVLTVVAGCIQQVFCSGLNARVGGDEFVTALWNIREREELYRKTEQLQQMVRERVLSLSDGKLSTSLCIGIACPEAEEITLEQLMHRSDAAMYAAKRGGKAACRFYTPELDCC